ncbi:hypothetical protein BDV18DRAFT_132621 [Aspergillus unguis]
MLLKTLISAASIAAQVSADNAVPRRAIQGLRKMGNDEGEKFFMHYWHYEEDDMVANSTEAQDGSSNTRIDRSSVLPRSHYFQPPFSPGSEDLFGWNSSSIDRRDFECPAGTNACTSINRSDSCCQTDETCVIVEDTGSGDVGCCPAGQDCSGTIGSCWEGYTSCSSSLGGGCCYPGYECVEEGCAHIVTITLTLSSTTLTTTSTETIPATPTSSTTTTTTATTTTTSTSTSSTSSTGDLSPPDRPTSKSTTTNSATETETSCPTGFYACAAVYQGGCCQTGRDCDTTSCPAKSSTTLESNGQTIVVAEPTAAPSADEGDDDSSEDSGPKRCASGWFSCADTVGGGCCPTGYACGSSCTAVPTASKTGTVAKGEPTVESMGARPNRSWTLICVVSIFLMML